MRYDDEREFVEFLSARMPSMRRTAYLLCGDAHRADDIVQAAATALYRNWRRARSADDPDAYAHRVLVRKYLDEKRLGWARVRLMPAVPDRAAAALAEPPRSGVEDRDALRSALADLPRSQRTVLVLRYACDMSVEDVASVLRCSPSNVKGHSARGLAALRRVLATDPDFGRTETSREGAADAI